MRHLLDYVDRDFVTMPVIETTLGRFVGYRAYHFIYTLVIAILLTLASGKPIEFIATMFFVLFIGFFAVPLWILGIVDIPLMAWYIAVLWWIGAVWFDVRPDTDCEKRYVNEQ